MKVAICRIHVVMWLNMRKFKLVFGIDARTYQAQCYRDGLYYRQGLVEIEGLAFSQVFANHLHIFC